MRRALVAVATLAVACSACGPAAAAAGHRARWSPRVRVTSVVAILMPYNPQFAHQGIPAERVSFTLQPPPPPGPFWCTVQVRHHGRLVGMTSAEFGGVVGHHKIVREGIAVTMKAPTFAGRPADARVSCHST